MEDEALDDLTSEYRSVDELSKAIESSTENLSTVEARANAYDAISKLESKKRQIGDKILDSRTNQQAMQKYFFVGTKPLLDSAGKEIGVQEFYHSPELNRAMIKTKATEPHKAGFQERMQVFHDLKGPTADK